MKPLTEQFHKHQCDKCGHVWKHSESCARNEHAHTCPQCNDSVVWQRYNGAFRDAGRVEICAMPNNVGKRLAPAISFA